MQDRKELEKYIKGLAMKTPQVIIQSRLGVKIQTAGNAVSSSSSNWFNISIEDYPDVVEDTKRALNLAPGESILSRLPLCVEISLRTTEGDSMVLEVWSLGLTTDRCDSTVRASHTVYNRMSILLKSLISVTRVTPAYKFSRRQSVDSYQILYRIYIGDPEIHCLGDGFKQLKIGQLSTTVGLLNIGVSYRTKMTISPTQTVPGKESGMMLKSDHFIKDLSPKQIRLQNRKAYERREVDLNQPLKLGAFVDANRTRAYSEDDYILPETPPFSWLLRKTKEEEEEAAADQESAINEEQENCPPNGSGKVVTKETSSVGSGKDGVKDQETSESMKREKLLKELHFPFATSNTPISDLAKFYRDCTQAPPLQGIDETPPEEMSEIEDLTQQLEEFEIAIPEFDSLVTSLYGQSFDEPFAH